MKNNLMRKSYYIIILILFRVLNIELYSDFPGKSWLIYQSPEEAGWSSVKLKEAKRIYDNMGASAVMVIYDGNVLLSYGDVSRRFLVHSIRKSITSALYGIHVAEGKLDINKTLEELGVDEKDSLSVIEKHAKISDMLKARSGVYIPAANETESMKKNRPKRGAYKPGEFWYYNNWDFNTLGAILEKETGMSVFENIMKYLAEPLGMEDFRLSDGFYNYEENGSVYPAYLMKMSARDLARFGLLYLLDGKWNGKEIIKESWIKESIYPYSEMPGSTNFTGYGYLWWLSNPYQELGAYCASGLGGQFIYIIPKANLVFVFRANTYEGKFVSDSLRLKFMDLILKSRTDKSKLNPKLLPLKTGKLPTSKVKLKQGDLTKFEGEYLFLTGNDTTLAEVKPFNDGLLLRNNIIGNTFLLSQSKKIFIMEDVGWEIEFMCNNVNKTDSVIISFKDGKKINKIIGKPSK